MSTSYDVDFVIWTEDILSECFVEAHHDIRVSELNGSMDQEHSRQSSRPILGTLPSLAPGSTSALLPVLVTPSTLPPHPRDP